MPEHRSRTTSIPVITTSESDTSSQIHLSQDTPHTQYSTNNEYTRSKSTTPSSMTNSLEMPSSSEDDNFPLITGTDIIVNQAITDAKKESLSSKTQSPSHKRISLLPPFPQSASINTLLTSILPGESKEEMKKNLIKEKLRRNEDLTPSEEELLFSGATGADNVRKRAVKKTFQLESLKHAIHSIKALRGTRTNDGYDYHRVDSIWDELDGDVLIMGGYRGSILRDKATGRRVWMPLKAGLNLKKIDLRIGPKDEDELNELNHIYPDRILSHVGPVDICKRLLKKLRSNPNLRVTDFGYDWRISLDLSAEQLCKKLQKLYDTQKIKKGTIIVAHSMGGLVAHKALQECTHLIRGIIYVGSPSQCPNILGPLRYGDEVLMNKTILSKEANFLMRSSFVFLPLDGNCFVEKGTCKKFNLDYFDPQIWIKLGLSPLVDQNRLLNHEAHINSSISDNTENEKKMARTETKPSLPGPGISTEGRDFLGILNPIPMIKSLSGSSDNSRESSSDFKETLNHLNPLSLMTKMSSSATDSAGLTEHSTLQEEQKEMLFKFSYDDCVDYLQRTLKRTKEFLISLEFDPTKNYPPLVIVYGNQVPTVKGAHVDGLKDVKLGNYEDFCYGPGDGVVYHKWLLPEHRGFPVAARVVSDCGHVSLMSDLQAMAKAFISLVDNDKSNVHKK
ncbi:YJR098C [Zygosaccharomyces parabailii]|nr:YJR098C [Zygosaccharomyces parabailii]CDH13379.1 uncharacterized protein ZBAI_05165 [Zygosaccharomyces bailii ISA1307]